MPIFEKEGIKINYEVYGEGDPLLFIQGLGVLMAFIKILSNSFKGRL